MAFLAILSSIGTVIGSILKAIPTMVWLCIVCVILGMVITSKGCSCSRPVLFPRLHDRRTNIDEPKQPRQPIFPRIRRGDEPSETVSE